MILSDAPTTLLKETLPKAEWSRRQTAHKEQVSQKIDGYLKRRQHQRKDPVMDFLFEYYAFRPSHLKRWSPGFGIMLESDSKSDLPEISELRFINGGAFLDPDFFPDDRIRSLKWMLGVLEKSGEKKPSFGCFGMHEWAMVYRRDSIRHNQIPLRMEKEQLADFVESRPLLCTHFDAFRFFSKPAKPLNKHELSRDTFDQTEQAGCIHTNMDLYKWAFKGFPWISSKTVWDAFKLAVEARHIDMQASPYDLQAYGLDPIKIETEEGRLLYVQKQKEIYRKSMPVRKQLIREYKQLVAYFCD